MILRIKKAIQVSEIEKPLLDKYWRSCHYPTGKILSVKEGRVHLETELINSWSEDKEFWFSTKAVPSSLVLPFYEVAEWMS